MTLFIFFFFHTEAAQHFSPHTGHMHEQLCKVVCDVCLQQTQKCVAIKKPTRVLLFLFIDCSRFIFISILNLLLLFPRSRALLRILHTAV